MRASRRGPLGLLFGSVFAASAALGLASPAWAYGPTPSVPASGASGGGPVVTPAPPAPPSAPSSGSSGVLAFTGADVAITTAAGAAAIGLGGAVVLLSRRRRDRQELGQPASA